MFSVSPAEMVTIALVALLVFGPRRLPEIARKAGRVVRDLRRAAADLREDIEQEYGDSLAPLEDARRELRTTIQSIDAPPEQRSERPQPPAAEDESPSEPDASA